MIRSRLSPTAWAAEWPKTRSAPWFHRRMIPSGSVTTMASGASRTVAWASHASIATVWAEPEAACPGSTSSPATVLLLSPMKVLPVSSGILRLRTSLGTAMPVDIVDRAWIHPSGHRILDTVLSDVFTSRLRAANGAAVRLDPAAWSRRPQRRGGAHVVPPAGRILIMTDTSMEDTAAWGADAPAAFTDGIHLVVDALKLNDVATIYGVVGIPVTDLARVAQASGIRYIGFRHESDAGHAAAAAGFLTKKPGICLTVSAPGFLNGLVALANATTNCFPMVQISGSSERHLVDLQRGDYEEMDQLAAARPFAKAAYRVHRAEDIGRGVARAIRTAASGRPGGVYLDIPAAVLGEVIDAGQGTASLWRVVDPAPRQLPEPEAVDRAIDLLASAERPLLVLGKGAAYAQADEQIREFIETTGLPYLPMSMAKGLLPDDHPQSAATARSLALRRADVVMLVGARLNWLLSHGDAPTWNPDAKFIQVDIAAAELDSNRPIAAPLVGDIGSVLDALIERGKPGRITAPQDWRDELKERTDVNVAKMAKRMAAAETAHPMKFLGALASIRDVLAEHPEAYVVNEGANAL